MSSPREDTRPTNRLKLSKTHTIEKSSLTDSYSLEDTHAGQLEHVGTYTECLKIAKGVKLEPIKVRRKNKER